jgi:hypothetical protein
MPAPRGVQGQVQGLPRHAARRLSSVDGAPIQPLSEDPRMLSFPSARRPAALLPLALAAVAAPLHAQGDFVVPGGTTVVWNTADGPIQATNVRIELGGTLRVVGATQPLRIRADALLVVDGTLDLSGADGQSVASFNVASLPVSGGSGGPVGGLGGFGNPNTSTWSARGGSGLTSVGFPPPFVAQGGESGFNASSMSVLRRPAGGGGGALGPDVPLPGLPTDPSNVGRVALDGRDGAPTAMGAVSLASPPRGGAKALVPFLDANPANDFFGRKFDPASGTVIPGELASPEGGRAGGAGGNAILSPSFPPPFAWSPAADERGGAGGGGGGLAILVARRIEIGPVGRIFANGGRGGSGENISGIDRIGGAGGGGSGGMLLLQARTIDLSQTLAVAMTALGGRGGRGANDVHDAIGAGGNGGPGLIQLHVPQTPNALLLPPGFTLSDITLPTAHVLLPEPGL